MAYVGAQPVRGQYRKLTDISGSFNGVTATFTTSVPPGTSDYYVTAGSASQLLVSLGGVIQQPDVDYTVSTNSITFTSAPAAGLSFFGVLMGDTLNSVTPSDGTIGTAKLAGNLSVGLAGGSAAAPSLYFTGDTNNGIYSPGADSVAISTNGAQRVTVDSSGRVLVGTSSARSNIRIDGSNYALQTQIETAGSTYANGLALIHNSTAGYAPILSLATSAGSSVGSNTLVSNGTELGRIVFSGSDGTNFVNGATILAATDAATGSGDLPTRLVFSTTADGASSPTERMRITNAGDIRIGTTGAVGTNVNGVDIVDNSLSRLYRSGTTTTSGQNHFAFFNPNGVVGSISTSGSATAYTTSSDYRLKENVTAVTDGITRLQQLKPSRFNFIADSGSTVDGFIAHEVQAVVPEAVIGAKDAVDADGKPIYQGIDQSKLVPLLTAALQEAVAKIETLEARLTAAGIA